MDTRTIKKPGRLLQPVLLLPLILLKPALYAQDANPSIGDVEIGLRTLAGDRSSSQFNEYRDITPGLYIQRASLDLEHLFQTNYFLTFQTRQSWQKDQRFLARSGIMASLAAPRAGMERRTISPIRQQPCTP